MILLHRETAWYAAAVLIIAVIEQSAAGFTEPFVVFTHSNGLEALNLTSLQSQDLYSNGQNVLGVDGMWNEGDPQVFWSDNKDGKIFRGSWRDKSFDEIDLVVVGGASSVEGIAVDWLSRNLFWVESLFGWIEMVSLDNPSLRSVVVTGILKPRAIALDARDGLLFWTDWCDSPKIERSSMSGSDRITIVDIARGGYPNGLTLDYTTRRVYWMDAKTDSIHSSDYVGRRRLEHPTEPFVMQNPFGLSIYKENLIWADAKLNSLRKLKVGRSNSSKILYETYHSVFGVTILHPDRHPSGSGNPCASGRHNCSHLCVAGREGGATCRCPTLMVMGSDNVTCEGVREVLVISEFHKEGSEGFNVVVGLSTESIPFHPVTSPIVTPMHYNAFGLAADSSSGFVYWADRHSNVIARASIIDGKIESMFDLGLGVITGFASDFSSGRLFYSMSGVHWGIYSCSLTSYHDPCSMVVNATDATLLGVQAKQRRLLWVEPYRNRQIFKSAELDGTRSRELCKKDNLTEFSGFAVTSTSESTFVYLLSGSAVTRLDVWSGESAPFAALAGDVAGSSILATTDGRIVVGDEQGGLHAWDVASGTYLGVGYKSTSAVTAMTSLSISLGHAGCTGPFCGLSLSEEVEPNDSPIQSASSIPPSASADPTDGPDVPLSLVDSSSRGGEKANATHDCYPPCLNGGRCETDMMGRRSCRCSPDHRGTVCQFAARHQPAACSGYCLNGGLCLEDRRTGLPQCQCRSGFYGRRCQGSLCADFCRYGTCELVRGRPVCSCEPGWVGPMCSRREIDVVAVSSFKVCDVYCLHGGTCLPALSHNQPPVCSCLPEYQGLRCEISETWSPLWVAFTTVIVFSLLIAISAFTVRRLYLKYYLLRSGERFSPLARRKSSCYTLSSGKSRNAEDDIPRIVFSATYDDDKNLLISADDSEFTTNSGSVKL